MRDMSEGIGAASAHSVTLGVVVGVWRGRLVVGGVVVSLTSMSGGTASEAMVASVVACVGVVASIVGGVASDGSVDSCAMVGDGGVSVGM